VEEVPPAPVYFFKSICFVFFDKAQEIIAQLGNCLSPPTCIVFRTAGQILMLNLIQDRPWEVYTKTCRSNLILVDSSSI
jgi:hypothetical protein